MEWSWEPPNPKPIGSMYGIFTYIWLIFMVNVGIYIYIPYMDPMGNGKDGEISFFFCAEVVGIDGVQRSGPKLVHANMHL